MKQTRDMRVFAVLIAVGSMVVISGCVTTSTDPSYMASDAYRQREAADTTLFASDQAVLGGQSIERILNSRVQLPTRARLAVLALRRYGGHGLWSPDAAESEKQRKTEVITQLKQSSRLADVSLLPTILTPKKKGIPQLREAAARFQAHLLLVYDTQYDTFEKYRLFRTDQARAYCTVEAILLDVRTGIVPFTSVSLQQYEVKKEKDDMNLREASMRAQMAAEARALTEIAADLVEFLERVPMTGSPE